MSGELFSEPGCPTLRESEDLHWSPGGPSPGLLPGAEGPASHLVPVLLPEPDQQGLRKGIENPEFYWEVMAVGQGLFKQSFLPQSWLP